MVGINGGVNQSQKFIMGMPSLEKHAGIGEKTCF
jgi:hypothetical protein